MAHPEYRVSATEPENITADTLTPIYPLTEGISQQRMRNLVSQSLSQIKDDAGLPGYIIGRYA